MKPGARFLAELVVALAAVLAIAHAHSVGYNAGWKDARLARPTAPCPCVERFRPGSWDCSGAVEWMPAEKREGE